jgi:hypothetical protein
MELPGVNADDVKLSLESNVLTIMGEKRQQSEETNERVHRYERSYGTFERTFVLPNTVDPEKIEAHYENGVLHVSIPKAERARPREIRVNSTTGGTQVRTGSPAQRVSSQSSRQGNGSRDPEEEGSAAKSQRYSRRFQQEGSPPEPVQGGCSVILRKQPPKTFGLWRSRANPTVRLCYLIPPSMLLA